VQATAARRSEKHAATRAERGAIELLFLVGIGPGEIGGGGDPVVDHARALVGKDIDACAAALFFARKAGAIGLTQKRKRSHSLAIVTRLCPVARRKPPGIALARRKRWR
jgi:hypothetical protein